MRLDSRQYEYFQIFNFHSNRIVYFEGFNMLILKMKPSSKPNHSKSDTSLPRICSAFIKFFFLHFLNNVYERA